MPNGRAQQVLTEEDLQRIDQSIRALDDAQELIDMAKQAGLDVAQFEERARDGRQRLLRFKNVFFPGR